MELPGRSHTKPIQGLQAPQHPMPNLMLVSQPDLKLNNPAPVLSCIPAIELTIYFPRPNPPGLPRWMKGAKAIP